jgi:hypothetical protein
MAVRNKISSFLRNFFRILIYYGMWLTPLCVFYFWAWQQAAPFYHQIKDPSLHFAVLAAAWWILSWPVMILLQTLWPALLLIFYKSERERSPKRIIPIGERFRKLGLPSPQIFILQETARFWRNKTWGFFALPSPVGSLLLIDKNISILLRPEQFDIWICSKATEAHFARFSSGRFLFITIVPTITLLGAFLGSSFNAGDTSVLSSVAAGFVFSLIVWRFFQTKSRQALDSKTISNFELDPAVYFSTLAEVERLNPPLPWLQLLQKRDFLVRESRGGKASWFKGWQTSVFAPFLLVLSFIGIEVGNKEGALLMSANSPFTQNTASNIKEVKNELKQEVPLDAHPMSSVPASETSSSDTAKQPVMASQASADPTPPPPPPAPAPAVAATESTELSKAIIAGNMRAVIQLIGHGQSLHTGDSSMNGATPLLLALKVGDLEMVYMLLTMGANLQTEVDKDGKGALFYALESTHRQAALNYILAAHVNIHQKSSDGLTAYDFALKNGWQDAAEILSKRAASDERLPANEK